MTEKKYLEYEKQFSGIDREEFINLLISKGATKIKDERIIRSTIFFHPLGHKDSYIRIRDEGEKIVMTSKNNLNKEFVNEYMSIEPKLKVVRNNFEKYLLRKSFETKLPDEVVWRRKDGFSDGVSKNERPWYQIINDYTHNKYYISEDE